MVLAWLVMMGLLVKKVHFANKTLEFEPTDPSVKIDSDEREWEEIYLKDRKVGYAVNLIRPFGQGYFVQEELFLKLNLMGSGTSLYEVTQAQVDGKFLLRSFHMMMTSGVVRFRLSGKVEGKTLVLTSESAGNRRIQRIALERIPMLSASLPHFFRMRKLKVGERYHLSLFDPASVSQKEIVIRVAGKESVKLDKVNFDAFRLEAEMWGKPMTFWVDEEGRTLKEEGLMGLTTVRSSAAKAVRGIEGGETSDLYEINAVRADRVVRNPWKVTYLKLNLKGVDEGDPLLNKGRQKIIDHHLEVTKERLPLAAPSMLPFRTIPDEVKAFLKPEFNIESENPQMVQKAWDIAGKARDPISVARRLLEWVYLHIEKKPVLSIPSALEVLQTRVGDCNEHATLLTALLRAVGIPARVCVGLVFSRDKFYYHAWTEAWLGTWISMDATLNQMPADATHIKLAEGNLSQQVEIARFIGQIGIRVIDFRYD
jgi:Transglutaminase-like superfamily